MAAMPIAPAAYPPPFAASEVIAAPEAPADEQLEVGVAIVGGGPAGLACAIRLAQLLEGDPAVAERLGEAPIALVDKGRDGRRASALGRRRAARAAAGAVPGRVAGGDDELRPGRERGRVPAHALARGAAPDRARRPCTTRATTCSRWRGSRASWRSAPKSSASWCCPRPTPSALLVTDGAVRGIRTGDKGRGRQGEELPTFEPGAELTAQATVLADGVQGMLSAATIEHFGLAAREPADLRARGQGGVARPAPARARRAHDRLAAQGAGALSRVRRHVRLPDGTRHDLPGARRRPRLCGRHALGARPAAGGEGPSRSSAACSRAASALAWGAKAIPEGGFWSMPASVSPRGRRDPGRRRRLRQRAAPEGRALRAAQRHAGRGDDPPRAGGRRRSLAAGRALALRRPGAQLRDLPRPPPLPEHAPGLPARPDRRRRAGRRDGHAARRPPALATADAPRRRAARVRRQPQLRRARRQADVRQALVGVRERQPQPRRPARSPAHPAPRSARARDRLGQPLPGAGLRGRRARARTASWSSR